MQNDRRPWFDSGELLRFAATGGTSALVYLGVLYVTKFLVGLLIASLIAYGAAMIVNYTIQKTWTFKNNDAHIVALPRYVVTHLGGVAINAGTLLVLVESDILAILPAQIFAFTAVAAWSYVLQKAWVFDRKARTSNDPKYLNGLNGEPSPTNARQPTTGKAPCLRKPCG